MQQRHKFNGCRGSTEFGSELNFVHVRRQDSPKRCDGLRGWTGAEVIAATFMAAIFSKNAGDGGEVL
jgi:hypothetical protein